MTDVRKTPTATEVAHAWQSHRAHCLELAIKAEALPENVVALAKEISDYIMTPSDREKGVTE